MGTSLARTIARERRSPRTGLRSAAACTPAFDVAANPATLRTRMAGADSGTRQRLADAGQRLHGNAALQRVLAPGAVLPVQRRARSRLSAVRVTVAHRTRAAFTAAVRAEWSSWIAEHQSAQTAIDPCTATFDCPASAAAPEPAGLESARGARRGRA